MRFLYCHTILLAIFLLPHSTLYSQGSFSLCIFMLVIHTRFHLFSGSPLVPPSLLPCALSVSFPVICIAQCPLCPHTRLTDQHAGEGGKQKSQDIYSSWSWHKSERFHISAFWWGHSCSIDPGHPRCSEAPASGAHS